MLDKQQMIDQCESEVSAIQTEFQMIESTEFLQWKEPAKTSEPEKSEIKKNNSSND